jgi:hypothetical protein
VRTLQGLFFAALLVGFWVPPMLMGRWLVDRVPRARESTNSPTKLVLVVAVGWTAIWYVINHLMIGDEYKDPALAGQSEAFLLRTTFILLTVLVILPGSALASWLAIRRGGRRHGGGASGPL